MQRRVLRSALPAVPIRFRWALRRSIPDRGRGAAGRSVVVSLFLVEQDALGRTVKVVILAVAQRPEEGEQRHPAQQQRERDEEDEAAAHSPGPGIAARPGSGAATFVRRTLADPTCRRSAFSTTMSEDSDIASAAISGVTYPAMAIGRATAL